jgi:Bacterial Ig-like domain (group 3)
MLGEILPDSRLGVSLHLYASAFTVVSLIAGFCSAGSGVASAAAPGSETTSATALTLSAPAIMYGDEQAGQFTVTVSGADDTPTGTVTVSAGATTVCTITLTDGTGNCAPTADEFPVGTVMLAASYSGDDTFDPSSSAAVSLQITSPPSPEPATSTTTLGLSHESITYGDEQAEKILVTVAAAGGTGTIPAGSVTVSSGSTIVCEFSLSPSGTGSCALGAVALPPGTAELTASYAGDADFASSISAAESLGVAKEPTTATVSLSATKVTYGAEQHERIAVAVKPLLGGTPTGQVTVKAGGTKIRVITLTSGKGTYTLAAASLAGGTVKLTASYGGDTRYAGSTSAPENLAVARTSSKTTLGLSAVNLTYGAETREHFSVAVKPTHGAPSGRVTVKAGSTVICVITLRSAKGTCSPSPARLATGSHKITAIYGGSADVTSSASAARTLSVAKASSKTTLSLSAVNVTYGSEGSEKISVKVAPRYTGTPGGTVTVKANGATLAVIRLESGMGNYTLSAKRLAAGTYSLAATYSGNAEFGRSASGKRSLTVASPPPPAPACHPLDSEGNCYEPGEYCPDADHGLSGIAGDGEAILCEDNDGWRWEPVG